MKKSQRLLQPGRRGQGFTLIELLVVLLIIGLLGGLVAPQVLRYVGTSKQDAAQQQIRHFDNALELYRLEVGRYPSDSDGLEALVQAPADADRWNGPYIKGKELPEDPWGNPFQYRAPGQNGAYDIYSLGADNAEGGEGEDADVVSWN